MESFQKCHNSHFSRNVLRDNDNDDCSRAASSIKKHLVGLSRAVKSLRNRNVFHRYDIDTLQSLLRSSAWNFLIAKNETFMHPDSIWNLFQSITGPHACHGNAIATLNLYSSSSPPPTKLLNLNMSKKVEKGKIVLKFSPFLRVRGFPIFHILTERQDNERSF